MRDYSWVTTVAVLGLLWAATIAAASEPPMSADRLKQLISQPWYPKAPPLPAPTGRVVRVATPAALVAAVKNLQDGDTVLIADGRYQMPHGLYVDGANNVTIRGASGDPTRVVLDYARARAGSAIGFNRTHHSTVAYLTIENRPQNGYKINHNVGASHIRIYNCIGHNIWQRHVKVPGMPDRNGQQQWSTGTRIEYCLFYNDRPKRRGDDRGFDDRRRDGYNYIGGLDIMGADGWVIRNNVFINIRGGTGEGRGAIFMWNGSRRCVIEGNIIIDCDAGICLGNYSGRGDRRHCEGFIVRNNFVTRCHEKNMLACHTRNCRILNNTVFDPVHRKQRLLRLVAANDGLVVKNNIFCGPRILRDRVTGKVTIENNLVSPKITDYFVAPERGDLHLTAKAAQAIDRGTRLKDVVEDIDGRPRGDKPDLGADEFVPAEK